jgi:hypothetical protein
MRYIPRDVQGPPEPDKTVRVETPVSAKGHDRGEREFPYPKATTTEIRGSGPGDHDGHKVSSVRLFDQRRADYEK